MPAMRSLIISSALLAVLVHAAYPVADSYPTTPSYPTPPPSLYPITPSVYAQPKKYPVATVKPSEYPQQQPAYTVPPPPPPPSTLSESDQEYLMGSDATTSASEYRKRAKARTAHNRHFQRRSLQPIRRFQQKKQ